jgi:hypothetical protein
MEFEKQLLSFEKCHENPHQIANQNQSFANTALQKDSQKIGVEYLPPLGHCT